HASVRLRHHDAATCRCRVDRARSGAHRSESARCTAHGLEHVLNARWFVSCLRRQGLRARDGDPDDEGGAPPVLDGAGATALPSGASRVEVSTLSGVSGGLSPPPHERTNAAPIAPATAATPTTSETLLIVSHPPSETADRALILRSFGIRWATSRRS